MCTEKATKSVHPFTAIGVMSILLSRFVLLSHKFFQHTFLLKYNTAKSRTFSK